MSNRIFSISGSIFFHYQTIINLNLVDSNKDIINIVIKRIRQDVKNYPGLLLELKKEEKKFHIHDIEFGNILMSDPEQVFYICSHCPAG